MVDYFSFIKSAINNNGGGWGKISFYNIKDPQMEIKLWVKIKAFRQLPCFFLE